MSADNRTVTTDALEVLGTIIDEYVGRDAIHLAVEPITAVEKLLPGQDVGLVPGGAGVSPNPVGIVDPFLKAPVQPGERFLLVVYPRQIKSLRHVWTHPAFGDEVHPVDQDKKERSEAWLRNFIGSADCPDYDTVMAAAVGDHDQNKRSDDPYDDYTYSRNDGEYLFSVEEMPTARSRLSSGIMLKSSQGKQFQDQNGQSTSHARVKGDSIVMDLPNLTALLEKATERPWERDATFIFAPGSSGFSNAPDGANIAAASELRASTCVQYDRPYSGSENLKEIFANARLLVLAANNFDATVRELQMCLLAFDSWDAFEQFRMPQAVGRIRALLAKIEREAGEL